jgi:hypothetical protein
MSAAAVHIGNDLTSAQFNAELILKIITAGCGDDVKVEALQTLKAMNAFSAQNVNISNNSFVMDPNG